MNFELDFVVMSSVVIINISLGRFNNYVRLKLSFLTHLLPAITLCHVCSRETLCVTSRSAQTPLSFSNKNEILGFKKDRREVKKSLSSFVCFFSTMYQQQKKRKHSNLRLKHYLHYKVRWKGTYKSYKTCYFGLSIPNMQSFL